ncbi:MAG: phosphatidylglycerophosphatase A [Betaproteobacteria bacterium]|nr:phosphatidylglycerophosphatase A [Betaproteobacteria bacterium]
MRPDRSFLLRHPAHWLAFGFGAGLMPKAPGTWGTLVAFPMFFMARPWGDLAVLGLGAFVFILGIWAAQVAGKSLGVADHGGIVIDEIAAFLIVLAFTPHHVAWWLAAFCLFRAFDIFKPWPIRLADRHIKGGFGVMFDDLLAAGYSVAALWLARTALS